MRLPLNREVYLQSYHSRQDTLLMKTLSPAVYILVSGLQKVSLFPGAGAGNQMQSGDPRVELGRQNTAQQEHLLG